MGPPSILSDRHVGQPGWPGQSAACSVASQPRPPARQRSGHPARRKRSYFEKRRNSGRQIPRRIGAPRSCETFGASPRCSGASSNKASRRGGTTTPRPHPRHRTLLSARAPPAQNLSPHAQSTTIAIGRPFLSCTALRFSLRDADLDNSMHAVAGKAQTDGLLPELNSFPAAGRGLRRFPARTTGSGFPAHWKAEGIMGEAGERAHRIDIKPPRGEHNEFSGGCGRRPFRRGVVDLVRGPGVGLHGQCRPGRAGADGLARGGEPGRALRSGCRGDPRRSLARGSCPGAGARTPRSGRAGMTHFRRRFIGPSRGATTGTGIGRSPIRPRRPPCRPPSAGT